MDINTASLILTESIVQDQKFIDVKKLALQVLEEKFQAEFTARDEALKLFSKKQVEMETVVNEKAELTIDYTALNIEKENLETESLAHITEKAELETALTEKETKITELEDETLAKDLAVLALIAEKAVLAEEIAKLKEVPVVVDVVVPVVDEKIPV